MKTSLLEIKTSLQIQKPAPEVYEAIVDPKKMTNYFISESDGRLEEGKKIMWKFPEFEMRFPIRTGKMEKGSYISYSWENDGKEQLVEISLSPVSSDSTVVTVTEKSMKNDETGISWLKSHTEGWANFLACLKAYMEYGINLRKGAFDFIKKQG